MHFATGIAKSVVKGRGEDSRGIQFLAFRAILPLCSGMGRCGARWEGVAEQERRVGVMHKEMAPNVVIRMVSGRSCVADAQLS